jgi:hypothetical protein
VTASERAARRALEREIASLTLDLRLARLGLTGAAQRSRHGGESPPGRWGGAAAFMRPPPKSQARTESRPGRVKSVVLPQPMTGWTLS